MVVSLPASCSVWLFCFYFIFFFLGGGGGGGWLLMFTICPRLASSQDRHQCLQLYLKFRHVWSFVKGHCSQNSFQAIFPTWRKEMLEVWGGQRKQIEQCIEKQTFSADFTRWNFTLHSPCVFFCRENLGCTRRGSYSAKGRVSAF